jgi:predicted lysophospholipase L1 biosynthesis ABC-type transport system permease subunit
MLVNETTARFYWPHTDPIGQCLIVVRPTEPCATIVGITKDSHLEEILEPPEVELITPFFVSGSRLMENPRYLIARTSPDHVGQVANAMRRELQRTVPPSAVVWVMPMASWLEPQLRPWRLGSWLFTAFGILALVVATVGTYSVVAYSVSQRAHEMSVRVALGAAARDVIGLIVGYGVRVTAVGIGAGVLVALVLARSIGSLLYGTTTHDPLVIGAVTVLLVAVAATASALPAWRASSADPVATLRSE